MVQYLKGTIQLELVYGQKADRVLLKNPLAYSLIGYTDGNFVGDPKDQKFVIRYYFFLNKTVVSWSSKKQKTMSISTIEVEYIALGYVIREAI